MAFKRASSYVLKTGKAAYRKIKHAPIFNKNMHQHQNSVSININYDEDVNQYTRQYSVVEHEYEEEYEQEEQITGNKFVLFFNDKKEKVIRLFAANGITVQSANPQIGAKSLYGRQGKQESLFVKRSKPKSFTMSVLFRTAAILCVVVMLMGFCVLGVGLGMVKAYVNTTPELKITLIESQAQTSLIYDASGKLITTFAGTENREWVNYDKIPDMLKNAFVAVEDVRFEKHNGVDFKRLASAIINTLLNKDTHGGSTITQQLIKNRILSNEQSYRRKIQEAYLALELEKQYDKAQILEAYLNAIPLGGINYGVKAAAADYFNKELDELTVRECAMLAGLTQNPTRYNPRTNKYTKTERWEWTNIRTDTVLKAMYNGGFISKQQYDTATIEQVEIVEKSRARQMYDMPYFVEYAIYDVITHMLRDGNLQDNKQNRNAMENKLRTGGYRIYTTVDPSVQNTVQETLSGWTKYPPMRDPAKATNIIKNKDGTVDEIVQPQAATVVMDTQTGEIKGLIGGRDEPQRLKLLNRAYQSKVPVGSSLKPLSIYGPALDKGAGSGTIEYNFAAPILGYGGELGYPRGGLTKQDVVTIREGVKRSLNVVAARTLFDKVGVEDSAKYLINFGIEPSAIKSDGPGLALGTSGVSPLEMTAAYACIANGGMYREPVAFTRVEDAEGKVLLDSETHRIKRQVLKPGSAYILTDMLKGAVDAGTGSKAKIKGIEVAGKTGTNDDYRSVYFAGFTPYYTSALWIGHDEYTPQLKSGATGGTYGAPLWQSYMAKLHEGKENVSLQKNEPASVGLVTRKICTISGQLATDDCSLDGVHKPSNEFFAVDSAPTAKCTMHAAMNVCKQSSKISTTYCPTESVEARYMVAIPESSPLFTLPREEVKKAIAGAYFGGDATGLKALKPENKPAMFCDVHSYGDNYSQQDGTNVLTANALLDMVNVLFANYGYDGSELTNLYDKAQNLQNAISAGADDEEVKNLTKQLQKAYENAVKVVTNNGN